MKCIKLWKCVWLLMTSKSPWQTSFSLTEVLIFRNIRFLTCVYQGWTRFLVKQIAVSRAGSSHRPQSIRWERRALSPRLEICILQQSNENVSPPYQPPPELSLDEINMARTTSHTCALRHTACTAKTCQLLKIMQHRLDCSWKCQNLVIMTFASSQNSPLQIRRTYADLYGNPYSEGDGWCIFEWCVLKAFCVWSLLALRDFAKLGCSLAVFRTVKGRCLFTEALCSSESRTSRKPLLWSLLQLVSEKLLQRISRMKTGYLL